MQDFPQIYAEHFEKVFRYVRSLCRDEALAEEVTQEAFYRSMKSIHKFRGECRLDVWLCQIAKHTLFSVQERRKRSEPLPEAEIASAADIERAFLDGEDARRAHAVLHRIPEPHREVFWMRAFGEMSFAEIGALFGKTESWARVTYYRARMKIREGLE